MATLPCEETEIHESSRVHTYTWPVMPAATLPVLTWSSMVDIFVFSITAMTLDEAFIFVDSKYHTILIAPNPSFAFITSYISPSMMP